MAFRFLHTADWHIGKSFGGFPSEKRTLLGEARMSIIDRIAALAGREVITHVLVAGDIFDSPKLADGVIRQALHRLGQAKNVTWHLLPGNHDPAVDRGIWDRVESLGRPSNVEVSLLPEVITMEPGVSLLTAPVTSARTMQDPTAFFDSMATKDGSMRVGLAHGSVQRFGGSSDDEASVLIAADRAERNGLDYLALGDWHGQKTITDRTSYSGTPEPENFVENEPGYVLSVSIDGTGAAPRVERLAIGQYAWSRMDFTFDGLAMPAQLLKALHAVRDSDGQHVLRLKLAGQLSLEESVELRAELEALADVIFWLEVNWDQVELTVEQTGDGLFVDERLAELADKLSDGSSDRTDVDSQVKRRALQLLARFAASNRGRQAHVD